MQIKNFSEFKRFLVILDPDNGLSTKTKELLYELYQQWGCNSWTFTNVVDKFENIVYQRCGWGITTVYNANTDSMEFMDLLEAHYKRHKFEYYLGSNRMAVLCFTPPRT